MRVKFPVKMKRSLCVRLLLVTMGSNDPRRKHDRDRDSTLAIATRLHTLCQIQTASVIIFHKTILTVYENIEFSSNIAD